MLVEDEGCFGVFISEPHGAFTESEVFRLRFALVGEDEFQGVSFTGFIIEMKGSEHCTCLREGVEIGCEGDARYHLGEVVCEFFSIPGGVQDTVNVVKEVVFRDGVVAIVVSEGAECCV